MFLQGAKPGSRSQHLSICLGGVELESLAYYVGLGRFVGPRGALLFFQGCKCTSSRTERALVLLGLPVLSSGRRLARRWAARGMSGLFPASGCAVAAAAPLPCQGLVSRSARYESEYARWRQHDPVRRRGSAPCRQGFHKASTGASSDAPPHNSLPRRRPLLAARMTTRKHSRTKMQRGERRGEGARRRRTTDHGRTGPCLGRLAR